MDLLFIRLFASFYQDRLGTGDLSRNIEKTVQRMQTFPGFHELEKEQLVGVPYYRPYGVKPSRNNK